MERQPNDKRAVEREFTIKAGGKMTTLKSRVTDSGNVLMSVSGNTCFVTADYGRLYFTKQELEVRRPSGDQPTRVLHG